MYVVFVSVYMWDMGVEYMYIICMSIGGMCVCVEYVRPMYVCCVCICMAHGFVCT